MYHTNFVHLHVHSHYSLLDGAAPVKGIIDAARRFRMPAIAITDHGNMFGAIELYQYALKRGVKPIIGYEAYLTNGSHKDRTRERSPYHIVLLARNLEGYKNLVKLSTIGFTDGFYYKPRIDFELMEKYSEGLIALSACLAGEIPQELLKEDREAAKAAIKRYQKIFGVENFYVEIQDHGIPEQQKILRELVEVARSCNAPIVATNDSHYIKPEDWEAQDALLCLSTNAKIDDVKRMRFETREFYLKSPQEMTDLFADYPEAISNSLRIAERCNVQLSLGKSILPNFPIPEGKTSESYMTELCYEGMISRYGSETPDAVLTKRLEYELSVIKRMGFCDYFLIVWDFIKAAREMGVPVGPGRGSAAGSIVAYLLRITDIDPIKYGLLFERFLNPERISMPDIDVDFSDDGRQKVIDYVVDKYGRNKVSSIITFNFILAKMAIRDIGRVLGMELSEVDRIAKMVPEKPGTHLKKVLYEVPELKAVVEHGTEMQKKLLRIAETVDGLVRHTGVHACGIVISHQDLMDIVPLYYDKNDELMTQYEKNAIESIGLLKMDFLGLKTLTILQRALENIKDTQGVDVDLEKIPIDDPKAYELLQQALTLGIFQLESAGMRNLIARLKPSVFEDIIALLAMYRPGPLSSGMVDDFVERKHGRKSLDYPHPDLEPVLRDTYGVFLYQEQVMQTANVLANFSMAQADALRKAMGKKIAEVMEKMGKLFVKGAVERGVPEQKAQDIFDLMAGFAEYGFNKSHSAAYAVITYRTAYLKAHYPVEFMAAVLSAEISNTDKIAEYVDECRTMGIEIHPPDVNISEALFKVDNGRIHFGMSGIKGVGAGAVESIVKQRQKDGPFKSLGDFTRRIDTRQVNSRVIDALIKAGAFDSFGLKKSQLIAMAVEALKSGQSVQKNRSSGQITFFDVFGEEAEGMGDIELTPPEIPELTEKELLTSEKEVFGFYLTGDPFNAVAPLGRVFSTHTLSGILDAGEGKICRIAGILTAYKRHITKKGDYMAFLTIEADNAALDVTLFPKSYQEYHHRLTIDEPMFMVVQTQLVDGTVKVNAEKILTLDDFNEEGFSKITLIVPPSVAMRENYQKLLGVLQKNPGSTPFLLRINSPEGPKVLLKPPARFRVNLNANLIKSWEKICGRNALKIEFPLLDAINRPNNRYRKSFKAAEG
ncbi:MAG: DNA polymerase III subunit alpha [Candidatus Riflebacteria bacterium HGW-Riflebacteria-1]|jgi:DNA polymerase-3 subunit alpha|nr:MAG: DNA polymerase III subunit alpha [Candidatus Riflebacteria bacterium HGW-Riflebacteria-1]